MRGRQNRSQGITLAGNNFCCSMMASPSSLAFTFLSILSWVIVIIVILTDDLRPYSLTVNLFNQSANMNHKTDRKAIGMFKQWETIYGLHKTHPPETISRLLDPPAHLQDCHRLANKRKISEMYTKEGRLPEWAQERFPRHNLNPPWIRGSDEDNLPYTRYIQTEIWKHQFPANCSDPSLRFMAFQWVGIQGHGLGSALHIFSIQLSMALKENRILVPLPGSFPRADADNCKGKAQMSMSCYFFSFTSEECEKRAAELWEKRDSQSEPLIMYNGAVPGPLIEWTSMNVENAWAHTPPTTEIFGEMVKLVPNMSRLISGRPWKEMEEVFVRTGWWHAQAIRFVLRWPSAYMCHLVNKARHEAYGMEMATMVVEAKKGQERAKVDAEKASTKAAQMFAEVEKMTGQEDTLDTNLWWDLHEPYIPRPIVSIHIRQGDKASEMDLFSLPSYMWLAERLRKHEPNMRNIWLSTEMKSVIDAAREYPQWKMYYTQNQRQEGSITMEEYTRQAGISQLTEISFVNLLISAQCDYFVGALGSNWNRLINELRLTNGRLKAGIAAVNFDDW